jgi:hypothetical protein
MESAFGRLDRQDLLGWPSLRDQLKQHYRDARRDMVAQFDGLRCTLTTLSVKERKAARSSLLGYRFRYPRQVSMDRYTHTMSGLAMRPMRSESMIRLYRFKLMLLLHVLGLRAMSQSFRTISLSMNSQIDGVLLKSMQK